jgi:DNA-binding transcriptional ArsR family regulator
MKKQHAVRALGALAHDYRIDIYRLLIRQGPEGLSAGAIGDRVGLVPSSLTFHLQGLLRAGLIRRVRVSRQLFYSADFGAMNDLVGYLTDECCVDGSACAPGCEPVASSRKKPAKAA